MYLENPGAPILLSAETGDVPDKARFATAGRDSDSTKKKVKTLAPAAAAPAAPVAK